MPPSDSPVHRYHDGTKHHFNRFARSLGYLDWASQPRPFRSFEGAERMPLWPHPGAAQSDGYTDGHVGSRIGDQRSPVSYRALFGDTVPSSPLSAVVIGDILRHSLGLSAWKVAGASRWALRVNPSSGNLHPTEAYIVCSGLPGQSAPPGLFHYAADAHVAEARCRFDADDWAVLCGGADVLLVALTSIHWREAWKYGERAFRYCQHDLGHAVAAVTVAARMHGWRSALLPGWSHADIASLTGSDRDDDFLEAEREEPGCLMALVPSGSAVPRPLQRGRPLLEAVARGQWRGRASQLSEEHVEWTFIDDIARATRDAGRDDPRGGSQATALRTAPAGAGWTVEAPSAGTTPDARTLVLQRRSAVAFDGQSRLGADVMFGILARLLPESGFPWDTLWWSPRIHLLLFVHRVDGLAPGLYLLARDAAGGRALRGALGRQMLEESAHSTLPLVCLAKGDCRAMVRRLSCDQDIAAEGFFSLGMIAEFETALAVEGDAFYRHLFWESGVVGHMLYLEAEAAGVRGTGIGCFYDDAVHEVLGLEGSAFQSLYHFTVGAAVDDRRLTTEAGYAWKPVGL